MGMWECVQVWGNGDTGGCAGVGGWGHGRVCRCEGDGDIGGCAGVGGWGYGRVKNGGGVVSLQLMTLHSCQQVQ